MRSPLVLATSLLAVTSPLAAQQVRLVSRAGFPLDGAGGTVSTSCISDDGRYVVFASSATNLVTAQVDTNGLTDVFLRDRQSGTTRLVSHAQGLPQTAANLASRDPAISGDGKHVVFVSDALDLVPGFVDGNASNYPDVYLYDVATGVVTLVSHVVGLSYASGYGGSFGPAVSDDGPDGVFVAFTSAAGDLTSDPDDYAFDDVFLYWHSTGTVSLLSRTQSGTARNGPSGSPSISDDGAHVAFSSYASDLVPGDFGFTSDVFLFDRSAGTLTLVSHPWHTTSGPAMGDSLTPALSGNGARVVFFSHASDLVSGFDDQNGAAGDFFVWDRSSSAVSLVSHVQGEPLQTGAYGAGSAVISGDGAYVAFWSVAPLVPGTDTGTSADVFLYSATDVSLVSHVPASPSTPGNGGSDLPSIAADGSFVLFRSSASDLVAGSDTNGHWDMFLYDRAGDSVTLVSHVEGAPATAGNAPTGVAGLSADGSTVAFQSESTNLLPSLTLGGPSEVFAFVRSGGTVTHLSGANPQSASAQGTSSATRRSMSADGRYVVFCSEAPNLVPGQVDANRARDVFLYDRQSDTVTLVSHAWNSLVTAANGGSPYVNPTISRDGTTVVFESTATDLVNGFVEGGSGSDADVFLYDVASGTVVLVSRDAANPLKGGNGRSEWAHVSDDGQWLAYRSTARTLVAGFTDGNLQSDADAFLFDRSAGTNTLVSRIAASATQSGTKAAYVTGISGSGSRVAFRTDTPASQLVTGASDPITGTDIFLYDRLAATPVRLVSHAPASLVAGNNVSDDAAISRDGNWVALRSRATNLGPATDSNGDYDIFLYDHAGDQLRLVSHRWDSTTTTGNKRSHGPLVSDDGAWVAYESKAYDLVQGFSGGSFDEPAVFLYSRTLDAARVVNHTPSDPVRASNRYTYLEGMSGDGGRVLMTTGSSNLLPVNDRNYSVESDAYLYDRATHAVALVSHLPGSALDTGNGGSTGADVSSDGLHAAFTSEAGDLVPADHNPPPGVLGTPSGLDVFLYSVSCGATVLAASPEGNNRIDLSWSSPGAYSFSVGRARTAGGPYTVIATTEATAFTDAAAEGGITYFYRVTSVCGASNEASAVTTGACQLPPDFPGASSATQEAGTTCKVRVTWPAGSSPCGGGVSYAVYRDTLSTFTPGPSSRLAVSLPGLDHVDSAGVVAGTTYYYVARATSAANGEEEQNTVRMPVTPAGCTTSAPAPLSFFAVRSYDGSNTLEWVNPVGTYTTTHVAYTDDGSAPVCPGGTPVPGSPFAGTAGARGTAAHGSLSNGTTYRYAACAEAGAAGFSSARESFGRPASTAGEVKWGYTTGATALAKVGIVPNEGYYVVSNDRILHGLNPGPAGGVWLSEPAWMPFATAAAVQGRPTVVRLPATTVRGASTIALLGSQDGRVYALNAQTGAPLWMSVVLGAAVQASPSAVFRDFGADYDLVLVGTRDPTGNSRFIGLSLDDGTQAWSFDNGAGGDPALAMGIVSGAAQADYDRNRVYFTSRSKGGGSDQTVWCLEFTDTGVTKLWSKGLPDGIADADAAPALAGGRLYVGTNDGKVHALHPDTGASLWSEAWPTGNGPVKGFVWPDVATGRIYFSTTSLVHCITDGGGSAAAFWSPVSVPSASPPLLRGNRLYVGGADSKVHSIEADSPTPGSTVRTVGDPGVPKTVGPPTLDVSQDLLIVGTELGVIYSVAPF